MINDIQHAFKCTRSILINGIQNTFTCIQFLFFIRRADSCSVEWRRGVTTDFSCNTSGFDALVGVSCAQPENAMVQRHDFKAMRLFFCNIADTGTVEAVVRALRAHRENAMVHRYGCDALSSLSSDTKRHVRMIDIGCVDAIFAALCAHTENPALSAEGCNALASLVGDHGNIFGAVGKVVDAGNTKVLIFRTTMFKTEVGMCSLAFITITQ